jgi:sulfite reductase beta subunit-like hemoprotein
MDLLAAVDMHGIQTSGNCIRNITTDAWPASRWTRSPTRAPCEILRQWSTLHPEFAFLPRKFKIAISGAAKTAPPRLARHRACILRAKPSTRRRRGGLQGAGGRRHGPHAGHRPRSASSCPGKIQIMNYLEAVVRVYNRYGRRDNMYKARIKILVKAGLLTDIIACPGGDFCALANAKSIPIAQAIQQRFDNLDYLHDLGDISLNISGCINACGHHHIGNIGILGVDKNGSEWYQITLGGAQGKHSSLGKVIGPSFSAAEIPDVIERVISTFVRYRESEERFVDTVQRIGLEPFKEQVYAEQPA